MSKDEKRIEFLKGLADIVNDGLDKFDASLSETLTLIEEIVRHCAERKDEDPCRIAEMFFFGMTIIDKLKDLTGDDVDHE